MAEMFSDFSVSLKRDTKPIVSYSAYSEEIRIAIDDLNRNSILSINGPVDVMIDFLKYCLKKSYDIYNQYFSSELSKEETDLIATHLLEGQINNADFYELLDNPQRWVASSMTDLAKSIRHARHETYLKNKDGQ